MTSSPGGVITMLSRGPLGSARIVRLVRPAAGAPTLVGGGAGAGVGRPGWCPRGVYGGPPAATEWAGPCSPGGGRPGSEGHRHVAHPGVLVGTHPFDRTSQ